MEKRLPIYLKIAALSALLAAGCHPSAPAAAAPASRPPRPGKLIALLYSSNRLGEYEPCSCPVQPLGGIARQATKIVEARRQADATLAFDAGDLFLPALPGSTGAAPPAPGEIERRARLIAAALARTGLTALTPGERDLGLGPALLRRVLGEAGLPVVSANLHDLGDGRRLFDPDRLVDAAGVTVGIFGVTRALPDDAALWRAWGVEARDPAAAARAEIASLRARGARLVIALLHVGAAGDARKLLAEAPGIDWAVLGHSAMMYETPEAAGGARLLEAMSDGKFLGRLDLHVVDGDLAFADRGRPARVQAILDDHRRQLADYRTRAPEEEETGAARASSRRRVAEIEKAIARETNQLATLPVESAGSWFENRIFPLDAAVPDHPEVALLVAAYAREAASGARRRRAPMITATSVARHRNPNRSPMVP